MERTENEKLVARMNHVVSSEDWGSWREYCEIEFRALVMAAMLNTDPTKRLAALDRAHALLTVTKGFELETEKLAKMLTFQKLDEDRKVGNRNRQMARVGGPQPYREEGEP